VTDTHVSGSWSVHCYNGGAFTCDLSQASFLRARNLRIASIAIAYVPQSNAYIGRFVVPLGVSFDAGLALEIGTYHAANLKYRRCERDGCYVEGVLPPALVNALQTPDLAKGAMDVVLVDGRKFQIPIGLDGFTDGLALLKQWTVEKAPGAKPTSRK